MQRSTVYLFGVIVIRGNAHQLLDNLLDELAERVTRMLYPEMVNEFRNYFRVGVAFENVPPLLQQRLHFLVVGHDTCARNAAFSDQRLIETRDYDTLSSLCLPRPPLTVVHHQEPVFAVGPLRVGIHFRGYTVGRPTRVRQAHVAERLRVEVDVGVCSNNSIETVIIIIIMKKINKSKKE